MKKILQVFQIVIIAIIFGCFSEGLKRTPLTELETQSFTSLGISMELPSKPKDNDGQYYLKLYDSIGYQKNSESKGTLIIAMHPFGSGTLAEPNYILDFKVIRLSQKQFDDFTNGKNLNNELEEFKSFKNKSKGLQTNIIENSIDEKNGNFFVYRRDIPLPTGDIVVAGAKLMHETHNLNYEPEDKAAIKKILNSIKPL
jgi:hypothetical protein